MFDVFLAHNSQDKPQIIEIARHLKQKGLNPWLDKEQIFAGDNIQKVVFQGISQSKVGAFFISQNGLGTFQEHLELGAIIQFFLRKNKAQDFRVIPVLLPGMNDIPEELFYLNQWAWIKFKSSNDEEALENLIRGIRGRGIEVKAQAVIQVPDTPPIIIEPTPPKTLELKTDDLATEKGIDYTTLVNLQAEALLFVSDLRQYIRDKSDQENAFKRPKMIKTSFAETSEEFNKLSDETTQELIKSSNTIDTDWILMFRGKAKRIRNTLISKLTNHNHDNSLLPATLYSKPKMLNNIAEIADEIEYLLSEMGEPLINPQNQPSQIDNLSSEKGIDYTRLRNLLAAKNWEEADKETYQVMIQAVGKKEGKWFTEDELLNFPCTDLRTIDRLWVKYSNGHFGFSVQKEIYLSVGGKADGKYYEEAWEKFGDRVGWRVNNIWIDSSDVTFDTSSPRGHLPLLHYVILVMLYEPEKQGDILFSRIKTCKL